jgi:hypothetical protein
MAHTGETQPLYDSAQDTTLHILRVHELLHDALENLAHRAAVHDETKLLDPEKPLFDEWTPKLKTLEYGSQEYKDALAALKPALDHHYAQYDHHPEHTPDGVAGMSLMALIEMLIDWKAAGERHATGDIWKSLEINRQRFGLSDQLYAILCNTARELGW